MGDNRIGDVGAAAVARAIRDPATARLGVLNIHHNGIGPAGAEAVASALLAAPHSVVHELQLADNRVGDRGAVAVARVLAAPGSTLTALNLHWNGVGRCLPLVVALAAFSAHTPRVQLRLAVRPTADIPPSRCQGILGPRHSATRCSRRTAAWRRSTFTTTRSVRSPASRR